MRRKVTSAKFATTQTLSDIARGMQHAVNTTQEMVARHSLQQLERYFEADGSPVMVSLKTGPDKVIDVPLVTLIDQSTLVLDEMQVELSLRITDTSTKTAVVEQIPTADESPFSLDRSSFKVEFAPPRQEARDQDGLIDIVMKFKAGDPPEGVARVVDAFNNRIASRQASPPE